MGQKPWTIAMLAAESVPYAKVGGLGDVVGALPQYLEKLGAHPIIIIPAYRDIHHENHGIVPYSAIPWLDVQFGPGQIRAEIFHTRMKGTSIEVYLVGCPQFFYRHGIYDDPMSGEGFHDNMERYFFFVKASLEFLKRNGQPIDIIHCHDSHTALAPGLLRANLDHDPFFSRTGSLYTIHNLAYQGIYPREALSLAGVDYRFHYPASPFEFWGKLNMMKVGIECADLVNTVSETYAHEIQSSPEYGYGLEGVLRGRSQELFGIVNGIDYKEWSPSIDPLIPARYSARNLAGKAKCKSEVLKQFGFRHAEDGLPLIGMVSRLADQKGFDLVADAMKDIAHLPLRLMVLGQGQQRYQDLLRHFAHRHPHRIAVKIGFDNRLAHEIYAGSDMFLMPSRFEPCGLNQLISLRYGTVPVVRSTGGLVDTVEDYSETTGAGTGFRFQHYSSWDMVNALRRALVLFDDRPRWLELMRQAMERNWSWEESARRYMNLYERIFHKKNPDWD